MPHDSLCPGTNSPNPRGLKVLMLVSQFRDDGIGVTVGELSKVLTSRGHRVTIGAFHFDRPTPDNVGVFALPRGARMKPWMLLHVFGDFDVIHHHQSAPLGISSFLRSGRFVSSFHGIPGLWQSHKYAALAEKLSFSASSLCFQAHHCSPRLRPSKSRKPVSLTNFKDTSNPSGE